MSPDRSLIADAANALCAARAVQRGTERFPAIADAATAYAVQAAVAAQLGGIAGWKAATFPDGRSFCAPLPGSTVLMSPSARPATCLPRAGIEGEVAFRIGRAIPASGPPIPTTQLPDIIAAAHAAIEIVDSRLADWRQASPLAIVADNLLGGALIIGDALPDWQSMDLAAPGLSVRVDGAIAAEAGRNAADPLALLGIVIAHCRAHGIDIPADSWVTTGTTTGLIFVDDNATVELMRDGVCLAVAGPAPRHSTIVQNNE